MHSGVPAFGVMGKKDTQNWISRMLLELHSGRGRCLPTDKVVLGGIGVSDLLILFKPCIHRSQVILNLAIKMID